MFSMAMSIRKQRLKILLLQSVFAPNEGNSRHVHNHGAGATNNLPLSRHWLSKSIARSRY